MKFEELIKSHSWLSVKMTLEKLFPDEKNYLDGYEEVFNTLKTAEAEVSDVTLNVRWEHDDFDNTDYVHVSGYYTNPDDREDEYSGGLAIEYTPWEEWLGMDIDSESLKNFSELEIIAYSLNEMTYAGFTQEDVQTQMDKLKKIVDDYEKMSPEEKKKNTYTWDEVKERFFNFDDEEKTED